MTARPDSYILKLENIKMHLKGQIIHCQRTLSLINAIELDAGYTSSATALEKANIDSLQTLTANGLAALQAIVWE
jgi:hypothetical protein